VIVSQKKAEEARLLLMRDLSDEELEANDSTVLCMSEDKVNALFRAAAKYAHPDAGGSPEAFAAVDRAKHILLHWLKRKGTGIRPAHGGVSKCPRCDGLGRVILYKGVSQLRVQCPTCQGNGEIYDERDKEGDRM